MRFPTVNLLSPSVLEHLALKRLRRRFAMAVLALVVLLGAGWALQTIPIGRAERELGVERAQTAALTTQVNALAPVRRFYAAVEQQKKTVSRAMASEALFSRILTELRAQTPDSVRIDTMSIQMQPSGANGGAASAATPEPRQTGTASTGPCPTPEPFTAASAVGCITIGGSAVDREAVGSLVSRLGDSDLFVGPFISTSTVSGEGGVVFTGTVGVTKKVFSGRYGDLGRKPTAGGTR